jgi:hydroxypyruvate isomerase
MPPLCAHLGYLFSELSLEGRFEAARQYGFSKVEHPNPYILAPEQLAELCISNDLSFVQMALPAGNPAQGEKGLACLPDRLQDFNASVEEGLTYARIVGSQFIHVMSGVVPEGASTAELWRTYIVRLRYVCEAASAAGLPVLIEPIGAATISNYLMADPYLALQAIEEVRAPNLFMLFDAFHAADAGIDPIAFVRQNFSKIAHLHIADHPGRHEPGTGRINFGDLFQLLKGVGYRGAVGLEYVPLSSTDEGLGWRQHFSAAA